MKCNPDIMKSPSLSRKHSQNVAIQWLPKSASAPKCAPLSLARPENHWPDRGRTSASPALFFRCRTMVTVRLWRPRIRGGAAPAHLLYVLLLSVRTDPGCSTGLGLLLGPASLLPARNLPLSFALRVCPRQSFAMVGLFPFQMAIHGL